MKHAIPTPSVTSTVLSRKLAQSRIFFLFPPSATGGHHEHLRRFHHGGFRFRSDRHFRSRDDSLPNGLRGRCHHLPGALAFLLSFVVLLVMLNTACSLIDVFIVMLEQRTGDARRASPGCEKACCRYSGSKTRK